jgi:hypothetical protein
MTRIIPLPILLLSLLAPTADAKDPGFEADMIRMFFCQGDGVTMEVFLPQAIENEGDNAAMARKLTKPVIGYYTLDLTSANKGKMLEPVKISMTEDGKTVIVDQYTRKLKPTRIPASGGTVDFDQRFGTGAKCGPFRSQDPNYR